MTGAENQIIQNIKKMGILFLLLLCFIYSCDKEKFTSITTEVPLVSLQDPYRTLPDYKFTVSTKTLKSMYEKNGV